MHVRAFSGQVHPDKLEEAMKLFNDSMVPAAKQQRGFKGSLLLTDPTSGKFLSLGFWESEADLHASEASGYLSEQLAKAAPHLATQPVQEVYLVSDSAPPIFGLGDKAVPPIFG